MQTTLGPDFSYGMTSTGIMVQVHNDAPGRESFTAMVAAMQAELPAIRGVLIIAARAGGPSAAQRSEVAELANGFPPEFRGTALLTGSAFVRGIVTAINWLTRKPVPTRSFSETDVDGALDFLKVEGAARQEVRHLLEHIQNAQRMAS